MNNLTPQIVTSIGLLCDIAGAWLVAIEVFRVFRGPTTIDIGDSGAINGGFIPASNPMFEKHEKKKHLFMWCGLALLLIGFVLQGVGAWLPVFLDNPSTTVQALRHEASRADLFDDILASKKGENQNPNIRISQIGVAPVVVVSTHQDSEGVTEENLNETTLKNLERWMVATVIQKARQAYAQSGYDPSLFNPKTVANSQIINIGGSKLAVVKLTMHANATDTQNAVRLVRILGFRKSGATTVGCMRNSNHDIPIFTGECGKKIKEVFGVSVQP